MILKGNGEQYMIGLRRLAAHQTVEIDVKAIRDASVPDETGKVLPMDTVRGQIRWTVRARVENEGAEVPDNLGMIGQSEQHDAARGMNTSYYCENCCPGSYAGSIIVPVDSLSSLSKSEWAKYFLENLPKFVEAGWMSDGTAKNYEAILKRDDLAGAFEKAKKDLENEFITSEVFHIIEGLQE